MTLKLLTEHHLEFLSFKGGCTGSSESTLVKMPHCWKSHVTAQICIFSTTGTGKKRYNVPTDVEASLDHLSLQSCPLVVLSRGDTKPQLAVNSEKLAKTEQEVPHPVGMVANKHMLVLSSCLKKGISLLAC